VLILAIGHPLFNDSLLRRVEEVTVNCIDYFLVLFVAITTLGDWLVPNCIDGTVKQINQNLSSIVRVLQMLSEVVLNVDNYKRLG